MTESTIYWLTRLDHIHKLCDGITSALGVIMGISIAMSLFFLIGKLCDDNDHVKTTFDKIIKTSLKVLTISAMIVCVFKVMQSFVPTTKEMAAIYTIPRIANNENVQGIANGIVNLANDWIEELKPNNVKKTLDVMSSNIVEQTTTNIK